MFLKTTLTFGDPGQTRVGGVGGPGMARGHLMCRDLLEPLDRELQTGRA